MRASWRFGLRAEDRSPVRPVMAASENRRFYPFEAHQDIRSSRIKIPRTNVPGI
jgi:hypothetical protein